MFQVTYPNFCLSSHVLKSHQGQRKQNSEKILNLDACKFFCNCFENGPPQFLREVKINTHLGRMKHSDLHDKYNG